MKKLGPKESLGVKERAPSKKGSGGVQKLDKTHISLVLSLQTYEQGEKQEALKGQYNMRFPLNTRLHIKLEVQWATPII